MPMAKAKRNRPKRWVHRRADSDFVTSLITFIILAAAYRWLSDKYWLNASLSGFRGGGVFLLGFEASFPGQYRWLYPAAFLGGFSLYFAASRLVRAAGRRGFVWPPGR